MKMQKQNDEFLDQDLEGEEEKIFIFTKGSDDVVINDLSSENSPDLPLVSKHVKKLSSQGYRVMILAHKTMTQAEYT